jgi:hypothetical protein
MDTALRGSQLPNGILGILNATFTNQPPGAFRCKKCTNDDGDGPDLSLSASNVNNVREGITPVAKAENPIVCVF